MQAVADLIPSDVDCPLLALMISTSRLSNRLQGIRRSLKSVWKDCIASVLVSSNAKEAPIKTPGEQDPSIVCLWIAVVTKHLEPTNRVSGNCTQTIQPVIEPHPEEIH